jgi:Zn-dependent peptidase ImmA (M78 family)/transcriptional regulator with XRE-family HTH domain
MAMELEHISDNAKHIRKARGLSQEAVAQAIGMSRQAYSAIESGRSQPRSANLIAMSRALGASLQDLLEPPPSFSSLRFRTSKSLSKREQHVRFELLHLFRRWLDDYAGLQDMIDERVEWQLQSVRPAEPAGTAAGARNALGIKCDEPVDDIIGLLESAGAKVFVRDFGLNRVFGFSAGTQDGGPAIAVNAGETISVERQIFTAAHELGHLLLHQDSYTDSLDEGSEDEEKEANQFASHFLLPREAFEQEIAENEGLSLVDFVLHVKRKYRISYKTVLFRLVDEYGSGASLYRDFAISYNERYGKNLRDHAEPDALRDPIARVEVEQLTRHDFVEGRLARLVRRAYDRELITASRAAEILQVPLEALRRLESEWVVVDAHA